MGIAIVIALVVVIVLVASNNNKGSDQKATNATGAQTSTVTNNKNVNTNNGATSTNANQDTPNKSETTTDNGGTTSGNQGQSVSTNAGTVNNGNGTTITKEKAQEIALQNAGVSASNARELKVELGYEDGREVYDVEFKSGNMEYDYDIDPTTGSIIKGEKKIDD